MKYFNPNYWFKLWILISPLFSNENKIVSSMPIRTSNIESVIEKPLLDFRNIESFFHKHRHSNHKKNENQVIRKTENIFENWPEKNESCIHEAGHAIILYTSQSLKDNFEYLEVYRPNTSEYNLFIFGGTIYKYSIF